MLGDEAPSLRQRERSFVGTWLALGVSPSALGVACHAGATPRSSRPASVRRSIEIHHADAGETGALLTKLFRVGCARRGAPCPERSAERRVRSICADPRKNSLTVVGHPSAVAKIRRMLAHAPGPTSPARGGKVAVFYLEHADATKLLVALRRRFKGAARIIADQPTNSLVVVGHPRQVRRIRRWIGQREERGQGG